MCQVTLAPALMHTHADKHKQYKKVHILYSVTHSVCGCRLFQVGQKGKDEEGGQHGWSPLLHWDPDAHQRKSQGLTYGQGWLSRKDENEDEKFINRNFCRFVFCDLWRGHLLPASVFCQLTILFTVDSIFTSFSVSLSSMSLPGGGR